MARQPSGEAQEVAINLDRGCLLCGGREVRLRAKTFQVLVCLHRRHGRLVTKEDLFRTVWPDTFVSDDSLTKCIREIRHALGDVGHQWLKTVARRGFILDAPLTDARIADADAPSERRTHNLPAALTSFIGRAKELAELEPLLASTRLLTLTGAGGCGKTRLAIEGARQMLDRLPDGVWLVDLTPLADPSLVAQHVASVLDVRQAPGRSLIESLSDQLRHRRMLLVLDNCEHVIAGVADLAEALLGAAAGLTLLATSREAIGVAGERAWRVASLTVPEPGVTPSDDLLEYDAVRLLVERATAAGSAFAVTRENAGAVADVCRRLDGIPLAIELAAVRLKVLTIEQIGARLDDRFRLLTRPDRARIGRQRTLEAAVAWSYDLLTDAERRLLRRLSTFAGGWTLDAAEHVCAGDGIESRDVLDLMTRLVDKSLVLVDAELEGSRRYRCLETVRHYGRDRLEASDEADAVRARHFGFFLDLARRAGPELTRAEQLLWLDRLDAEHDNLRVSLEWSLASRRPGAEGLELAASLHWFWLKRAYFAEGQRFLERALAKGASAAPSERAPALLALGSLVFFQGDFERADRLLGESAALAGEPATAALALGLRTMAAMERGDRAAAARCAVESAAAARASGERWLEGFSLTYSAYEALYAGDVDRAGDLHEHVLALGRARGDLWGMGIVLFDLGLLRVVQHRYGEARALCCEGMTIGRRFRDRRAVAWCLGVLAAADAAEGQPARAARLLGAMEGLLDGIGSSAQPTFNALIGDRLTGALQEALGTAACQRALAAGRALSLSQAIDEAIGAQTRANRAFT